MIEDLSGINAGSFYTILRYEFEVTGASGVDYGFTFSGFFNLTVPVSLGKSLKQKKQEKPIV